MALAREEEESRCLDIMTLLEIKEEVLPKLTPAEKLELARAIAADGELSDEEALAADNALWDAQLREDIATEGPMFQLGEEALAELRRGESPPGFP